MEHLEMVGHLVCVLFIAAINAGLIICMMKWGWLDWYEYNKQRWMPDRCEFCLGFWMAVVFCLFLQVGFPDIFFYSLCAAVVTRKLI